MNALACNCNAIGVVWTGRVLRCGKCYLQYVKDQAPKEKTAAAKQEDQRRQLEGR